MKIKRNAPCPCGSGKKYKKCCIDKETPHSHHNSNCEHGDDLVSSGYFVKKQINSPEYIHPYVVSKFIEPSSRTSQELFELRPELRERSKMMWYPSKVRSMKTEEIIEQLKLRGAQYSEAEFIKESEKQISAWGLAKKLWLKQIESWDQDISDFVGLASCILWEKLFNEGLIEKFSIEMLDDLMQEGYQNKKNCKSSADCWLHFWSLLERQFNLSAISSIDELDEVLKGTQSVFNWSGDMEMSLLNASINNENYAKKAIHYFEGFLAYFGEKGNRCTGNYKLALAECYCRISEYDKGKELMINLINEDPTRVQGYIGLEQVLSFQENSNSQDILKERLNILKKANDFPVVDGHDYDLIVRIEDLEEDLIKSTSSC